MGRERWGTVSVRDHTRKHALAAEVLMYDRLVIPRPPDLVQRHRWWKNRWQPRRLDAILDILGLYGPGNPQGRAVPVDWNEHSEGLFRQRAQTAQIVGAEANYGLTRRLLATELLPEAPPGVVRVAVLAAYPSVAAAQREWIAYQDQARRETLTMALSHRFVLPDPRGKTDLELMRQAVDLAGDSEFQSKRARMYAWQDDVIRNGVCDSAALDEMAGYVDEYEAAMKRAVGAVYTKFAFTLAPIAAAALGGPVSAVAGVGSIANLVRFWIFDRKPVVQGTPSEPAAMFHAIQHELGWLPQV